MNGISSVNLNFRKPNSYYFSNPNNNGQEQGSESNIPTGKTVATAGVLQGLAMLLNKISQWCGNKLMQGKEFTSGENIKKVAKHMVDSNGLKVNVDFIDNKNIKNYAQEIQESLKPVARGENAFYADGLKLAVAPKSKPSLILHELGHAINAQKGKFMRFLQKSRGYAAAIPTTLVLFKDSFKRKDNKPNFFERNAGLIGFAAFLPTIVEEGLASIRGIKAAKKVLGKGVNLGALKRNYAFAWLTYVIAGVGLGIAAKLAVLSSNKKTT